MQCRSMRDNHIFYRIHEQSEETDEDCEQKILTFIEDNLKLQNARTEIKRHRFHRMGRLNPSKIRPIIAKFPFFPEREKVRKSAGRVSKGNHGREEKASSYYEGRTGKWTGRLYSGG